jgi:hypothetical protein
LTVATAAPTKITTIPMPSKMVAAHSATPVRGASPFCRLVTETGMRPPGSREHALIRANISRGQAKARMILEPDFMVSPSW